MDTILLTGFGALFALLFALNNIVKTLLRKAKIGFLDLLLAFLAAILPVVALIYNNLDLAVAQSSYNTAALMIAGALAVTSLLVMIAELLRPERLRGSRGILGLWVSGLVALATFGVPFASAYFAVPVSPPVLVVANATAQPAAEADSEAAARAEIAAFFIALLQVVADETGLTADTIQTELDSGTTVAQLVSTSGGDLESVIEKMKRLTREQIETMAASGDLPRLQASLFLSQLDLFVRRMVVTDLTRFARDEDRERRAASTAEATDIAPTQRSSDQPTSTPQPSFTPTASRTPRAPTPTLTPFGSSFSTRTPIPTATPGTPCLVETLYNLRLRTAPTQEAETLLVIPFNTVLSAYGRNEGSTWLYVIYEEQSGWIDREFARASSACDSLALRQE